MDDQNIDDRIAALKEDAVSRGSAVEVRRGSGASQNAISECEQRLGRKLPNELVAFLEGRNGLSLFYYEKASTAVVMPDAWSARFEIHGTTGIAKLTLSWREFFADAMAGSPGFATMREQADEIIILANQSDIVTYVESSQASRAQSCPVWEFDQEQYDIWLETPRTTPIAPSIAEHVIRSIDMMMSTHNSFIYWD